MIRLRRAVVALGFLGIGLMMLDPLGDPDLWWLLAGGQYMVENRTFLTTDPFSASAQGATWLNHAWGFELLLYAAHRVGGVSGLICLGVAFAMATFGLLYRQILREGGRWGWALLAVGLGALATHGFWAPRPQLVTYLFLALYWTILRDYVDARRDRLWWLVPLSIVWVNLHGGFAVGLALIGLVTLAETFAALTGTTGTADGWRRPRRLLTVGLAAGAATLLNPFHVHAVLFPFQVLGETVSRSVITEWASPPFSHPQVRLIEGLVLLTLVLLLRSPRRTGWPDVMVLGVFLHLAVHATRNLPLFVLLLVPILGRLLSETVPREVPALGAVARAARRRPALACAAGGLLLVGTWSILPGDLRQELIPRLGVAGVFPEGAAAFLERTGPGGGVFSEYAWGGYLIWRLYPGHRVWIDGRAAVHGPERFIDYVEIDEVRPRWRETLDRTGVGLVLLRPRSRLARVLRASPDWEVLYADQVAVVLGRRRATS